MIKLIASLKGTGKTKTLIEMVNAASKESSGSVICLESGEKLRYDINYQVRLVDVNSYDITNAEELFGFVSGMFASNHDITHIFIDSAFKMCKNDAQNFSNFFHKAATFSEKNCINFVVTASVEASDLPADLSVYM